MNVALVLIGGNGSRIHSSVPKQFIEIKDIPLFIYTLFPFEENEQIDSIILVSRKEYTETVKKMVDHFHISKVKAVVEGGSSRQESVRKGLNCPLFQADDIVLIHDGDRPNVTKDIIENNLIQIKHAQGVLTATKVKDTIYSLEGGKATCLNRAALLSAQTPQTFSYSLIHSLHEKYQNEAVTDDISLLIKENIPFVMVEGSDDNFKITTNEDLEHFVNLKKASL